MANNQGQERLDRALLARLDKPEDLKKVLAREQSQYDCLSCRVMGMYTCASLSSSKIHLRLFANRRICIRWSRCIHILVWSEAITSPRARDPEEWKQD